MNKARKKRQQRALQKARTVREEEEERVVSLRVRNLPAPEEDEGKTRNQACCSVTMSGQMQGRILEYCKDTERTQAGGMRYLLRIALDKEGY